MFAARGHDRRSPPVNSQGDGRMRTGTGPETTSWSRWSTARHSRADSTAEARRSSAHRTRSMCLLVATEDGQMVGFDAVLSLTWLSASRRPSTCHGIAERSGRPNGPSRREAKCSAIKRELWRLRAHVVAHDPSRPSITGAPSLLQSPQPLAWLTCVVRQT